jgi:hypothetical protein
MKFPTLQCSTLNRLVLRAADGDRSLPGPPEGVSNDPPGAVHEEIPPLTWALYAGMHACLYAWHGNIPLDAHMEGTRQMYLHIYKVRHCRSY